MSKKKYSKSIIIILLIIFMAFFSGCISIKVEQTLKEDGKSDIEIIYDMSALVGQMDSISNSIEESFENSTTSTESENLNCEEFEEQIKGTPFTCSNPKEGIIVLSGNWQSDENYFKVEKTLTKTIYEYDAMEYFIIINHISLDSDEQITKDSLAEYKLINPTLKYTITMPTTIQSTQVGSINNNKVTIDIFDLEDLDSAKIIAVENNNTLYYIIGGIVSLIIILVLIKIIISKKKNKNSSQPQNTLNNINNMTQLNQSNNPNINSNNFNEQNLDETELKCKNYIIQYKQYPRESLKNNLIQSGITAQKVEEYLNKYY